MLDILLSPLLAVCLSEVKDDIHHQYGHDNYQFRDYVCSVDNLSAEVDCGKLQRLFELKSYFELEEWRFLLSIEMEAQLAEVYLRCCKEA